MRQAHSAPRWSAMWASTTRLPNTRASTFLSAPASLATARVRPPRVSHHSAHPRILDNAFSPARTPPHLLVPVGTSFSLAPNSEFVIGGIVRLPSLRSRESRRRGRTVGTIHRIMWIPPSGVGGYGCGIMRAAHASEQEQEAGRYAAARARADDDRTHTPELGMYMRTLVMDWSDWGLRIGVYRMISLKSDAFARHPLVFAFSRIPRGRRTSIHANGGVCVVERESRGRSTVLVQCRLYQPRFNSKAYSTPLGAR
ncbi:hypothetical protein B0H16DRAFT_1892802 [Mycena metata]|uniref:Uncharacterized protein n=1 Tax=Mycena metata TaxID=1033252 RepID=A0AAD7I2B5_9AGAR|nr:hypothetical protein B0H16DRAFT_1892802 [Mycena metata]